MVTDWQLNWQILVSWWAQASKGTQHRRLVREEYFVSQYNVEKKSFLCISPIFQHTTKPFTKTKIFSITYNGLRSNHHTGCDRCTQTILVYFFSSPTNSCNILQANYESLSRGRFVICILKMKLLDYYGETCYSERFLSHNIH